MTKKEGILISFSGIDGAGKSTQVKLILDYLNGKGKRVEHTESLFGYIFLKPLVAILRTATGNTPRGSVKRTNNNFAKIWFIPALLDIWLGYVFVVKPKLRKYDYLLADRFYSDIWANLLYYGYLPNWAFKLVKILPRSDIPLMLNIKPKSIEKRESDFPPAYYQEQFGIYNRLSKTLDFYMINANKDKDAVFRQILKKLK